MIVQPLAGLTPVAAAAALRQAGGRAVALLDGTGAGGAGDGGLGRWSFVTADPSAELVIDDAQTAPGLTPLDELARRHDPGPRPGPWPFAIGWLGYECGRAFERVPSAPRAHRTPDLCLRVYRALLRFDHQRGACEVIAEDAAARDQLLGRLAAGVGAGEAPLPALGRPESLLGRAAYCAAVERVLGYLVAGDAYQVNFTDRLRLTVGPGDLLALYRALIAATAAPLGAYLETADGAILSTSPELFLRVDETGRVETRPIKGTRRRGADAASDAAEVAALLADDKERAEHLMIVDLERSDLGRVCQTGSVRVEGYGRVVTLPALHHVVSTVVGQLRAGVTPAQLLAATFPCGSITGAPKIRAMQIIAELEPASRGVYTGAIGYLGAGGTLELSVAIRTAVVDHGQLTFGVGGGIVVDSTPEREWDEAQLKARALATIAG